MKRQILVCCAIVALCLTGVSASGEELDLSSWPTNGKLVETLDLPIDVLVGRGARLSRLLQETASGVRLNLEGHDSGTVTILAHETIPEAQVSLVGFTNSYTREGKDFGFNFGDVCYGTVGRENRSSAIFIRGNVVVRITASKDTVLALGSILDGAIQPQTALEVEKVNKPQIRLSREQLIRLLSPERLIQQNDRVMNELGARQMLAQRARQIRALQEVLGRPVTKDGRPAILQAIHLAGGIRAQEIVPLLTKRINLKDPELANQEGVSVEELYPAVQALINIGSPSTSAVVDILERTPVSSFRRDLSMRVLTKVHDPSIAKLMLEQRLSKASDEVRPRLENALQFFEQEK